MREDGKIDYIEFPGGDLPAMEAKVRAAGGTISRPIFSFPGGGLDAERLHPDRRRAGFPGRQAALAVTIGT